MKPGAARRRDLVIAAVAVVVASIAYRLPALVNAEGTNADAAVVGLQAMHILRGEHAVFLWGSGYQTSADSYVAAAWFAILGPSGLALRLSTLVNHVALTLAVLGVLTRRLRPALAALLVGPLVLTSSALHTYILYPPRQFALTLSFVGLWLADGASFMAPDRGASRGDIETRAAASIRGPHARFAIGCALGTLACGADPYTLLFLPLWGLWALFVALDAWPDETGTGLRRVGMRLASGLAGALIGAVPFLLLVANPRHREGTFTLNWADVPRRFGLLAEECFPALVSTRVYSYAPDGAWGPYPFSASFVAVSRVGAWLFVIGIASGFALAFVKRIPWSTRRIGLVGAVALPLTLAAFLSSNMIMDRHASRYLVAIVLFAPFALAPAAFLLRAARAVIALTPYLVSVAYGGWTSYRPWTDGARIDATWGRHEDEWALFRGLRERGIDLAIADYWSSYRLGFLWREAIVVVPKAVVEDRYPPQREAFSKAPRIAYIHDPERSSESPDDVAAAIAAGKTPFEPTFERLRFGAFTAFVLTRREIAPNLW